MGRPGKQIVASAEERLQLERLLKKQDTAGRVVFEDTACSPMYGRQEFVRDCRPKQRHVQNGQLLAGQVYRPRS